MEYLQRAETSLPDSVFARAQIRHRAQNSQPKVQNVQRRPSAWAYPVLRNLQKTTQQGKLPHLQGEKPVFKVQKLPLTVRLKSTSYKSTFLEKRRFGYHDSGKAFAGLETLKVSKPTRATRNFELIEHVAHTGNGLVDLWEESPIRVDSNEPKTDQIIDLLFPGNPLLCCGWTRHHFATRLRAHWHKLHEVQFIVPSPMTARQGLTRDAKLSAHALSNTGPRRFLIVEFDFDSSNSADEARLLERLSTEGRDVKDLCAALLLHLAEKAPLALIVYSGGRSLHGWFYCAGVPEERVWRNFQYAVSLGADPANWTPSQFARMPDGLRENGSRQTVYFLNREVIK